MPQDATTLEQYVEIPVSETDPETNEPVCYIIRPFRGDVWNVSAAVELAASRAGLKPTDLKLDWNPLTILSGSAGKTQNARVVVAILHDRMAAQANPNVMYELGLAHALGKPTLIVAKTDAGSLPAMINNVPCIPLPTDEQVVDDTFFRQITEPLRTLLNDKEYHNIVWPSARRRHGPLVPERLLRDPDFYREVTTLRNFGNNIYQRFLELGAGHVSAMTKPALEQTRTFQPKSFEDFRTWLITYDASYRNMVEPEVYVRPKVSLEQARDTIFRFLASLGENAKTHGEIQRFFGDIVRDVRSWPSLDERMRSNLREIFGDIPITDYFITERDPRILELTTDVYAILRQMLGTCASLVANSFAFVNLVNICATADDRNA